MADLQITSFDDMKKTAYSIVPLTAWDGVGTVNVKLRRVDLFMLMQEGTIPNELLSVASKAAMKPKEGEAPFDEKHDPAEFQQFVDMQVTLAEQSLVQPTYQEIVENVGPLTQKQLLEIFAYNMAGVRALHNFRSQPEPTSADGSGSGSLPLQTK